MKPRLQAVHGRPDGLGNVERIGTRLQIDADGNGWCAVIGRGEAIVQRAKLHAGDILDTKRAAEVVGTDDDLLEFAGIGESALGRHRICECRRILLRLLAEASGCELRVLLADSGSDISRRQVVLGELVGPQPDPHRIVGRAK